MTYDEFILKYLDHIEGKVDAEQRVGTRPLTADDNEQAQQPDKQSSHVKNNSSMNAGINQSKLEQEEGKGEGEIEKVSEKLNESAYSKHTTGKKDDLNKSKDSMISKDDYKYEIPDSCFLSLMKGN